MQSFLQGYRTLEDNIDDPVYSRQRRIRILAGKQNTKQGGEIEDFVRNLARQVQEGAEGIAFVRCFLHGITAIRRCNRIVALQTVRVRQSVDGSTGRSDRYRRTKFVAILRVT